MRSVPLSTIRTQTPSELDTSNDSPETLTHEDAGASISAAQSQPGHLDASLALHENWRPGLRLRKAMLSPFQPGGLCQLVPQATIMDGLMDDITSGTLTKLSPNVYLQIIELYHNK